MDKVLHFIVGALICLTVTEISDNLAIGILASIIIGFLKEIYDSLGHGTVDVYDFIATVIGGFVMGLVLYI